VILGRNPTPSRANRTNRAWGSPAAVSRYCCSVGRGRGGVLISLRLEAMLCGGAGGRVALWLAADLCELLIPALLSGIMLSVSNVVTHFQTLLAQPVRVTWMAACMALCYVDYEYEVELSADSSRVACGVRLWRVSLYVPHLAVVCDATRTVCIRAMSVSYVDYVVYCGLGRLR
jgi:hypothetical protein